MHLKLHLYYYSRKFSLITIVIHSDHMNLLQAEGVTNLIERQRHFPKWFTSHVSGLFMKF